MAGSYTPRLPESDLSGKLLKARPVIRQRHRKGRDFTRYVWLGDETSGQATAGTRASRKDRRFSLEQNRWTPNLLANGRRDRVLHHGLCDHAAL